MAFSTNHNNGISAEMNVTPMIDILLVLLVIFMILVPFDRGEIAEIPQSNSELPPQHPDSAVVIEVQQSIDGKDPALKINTKDVSWEKLEVTLKEIFKLRSQKVAFIKGDSTVDFQYVADVIDTAHHAGVERIGLMGSQYWKN